MKNEKLWDASGQYLMSLGWQLWNKQTQLYLCPLSQFDKVPDGIIFYSISGKRAVVGKDHIDKDTRDGFLAWGIIPGKQKE